MMAKFAPGSTLVAAKSELCHPSAPVQKSDVRRLMGRLTASLTWKTAGNEANRATSHMAVSRHEGRGAGKQSRDSPRRLGQLCPKNIRATHLPSVHFRPRWETL